jgi:hypothetical protein
VPFHAMLFPVPTLPLQIPGMVHGCWNTGHNVFPPAEIAVPFTIPFPEPYICFQILFILSSFILSYTFLTDVLQECITGMYYRLYNPIPLFFLSEIPTFQAYAPVLNSLVPGFEKNYRHE